MVNPGKQLRQVSFKLAQATFTPVPFWLSLTVSELLRWIQDINEASKKEK